MRCAPRSAERHARYLFSEDGTTIDEQVAGLLRGRRVGLAESCSGGLLAARLTRAPGRLGVRRRQRGRLLEPGEVGPARRRPGADRAPRRRLARGRRGDGRRGAGAVRCRHRRVDHRDRRPRGRHEGEAGGLRLLLRQAGRRTEPRARPGDPRAAARTSASAPRWSGSTCCASCSAAGRRRSSGRGARAVRGPRRRPGPRRPARAPRPDPLAVTARRGGLGAGRRRRLPARALRALGRPLRLAGIRVTAERALQPSLERPPPDLGAKPGRRAAGDADPRLAGRADRVPGRDPAAGGGGTRRGGAVAAGLRVVR